MNRMQLAGIGVLAGALTIVGAVGPWATFRGLSFSGTDANRGVTVAIAAGVGLLLMALAGWKNLRWAAMLAAVAGLLSFGLTIWSFAAINAFAGAPERAFDRARLGHLAVADRLDRPCRDGVPRGARAGTGRCSRNPPRNDDDLTKRPGIHRAVSSLRAD